MQDPPTHSNKGCIDVRVKTRFVYIMNANKSVIKTKKYNTNCVLSSFGVRIKTSDQYYCEILYLIFTDIEYQTNFCRC